MLETPSSYDSVNPDSANPDRHPAFGSVVAGGGLALLLVAGATYVVATMLGIEGLLMPGVVGMGVGLAWFVVSRLARVGHEL